MKNKIYKYDFLVIGAGLIGAITALALVKKKFKVLVIDKKNSINKDNRTLAVNANSVDFLKKLDVWKELKTKPQPINKIVIQDQVAATQDIDLGSTFEIVGGSGITTAASANKITITASGISNAALANPEKKKLAQLPESKITESKFISKSEEFKFAVTKKNDVLNTSSLSQDENLVLKKTLNNTNSLTNEGIDTKFREINFSYPAWKPNDKTRLIRDLESIKREYENLGDNSGRKELNIDA